MSRKSPWFVFVLVAIAQFMVVLDNAITNVALPSIAQNFHFTNGTLQWVVTAYALCFGGFLLLGGKAADLFGRRRMLLIGMALFTVFSLLIGISQTSLQLVVLRALQGLSAAFMSPAALSTVLAIFKDGAERGKALGYWTLVATGGAAIGLLLGGLLTELFGWRWNFFINVPVGIIMLYLISKFVLVHIREEKRTGIDVPGAMLVTTALMSLVLAFSQAPDWGWFNEKTLGVLAVALILLAGFIWNESRVKHPLMPLNIFKVRNIAGANLIMALIYAGMLGMFFITALYLQVLHYSPITVGLSFLPVPILLGVISTRVPKLVARYGFRRFLIIGPVLAATGVFWLSQLHVDSTYWLGLLPALIIIPIGIGMTFMPTMAAATAGVPAHEAGLASGLISTSQQMGGALGLAILSSVAASVTASSLSLGTTEATMNGFRTAFLVTILFMIVAVGVASFVIKQKRPTAAA